MNGPDNWPLALIILAFAAVAAIIGVAGIKMTKTARDLAQATGLGQALMGAVFIGASTSLSGITTSVTAAAEGYAQLAVSNGLGGIAAQTVFLALADIVYRRANLEHAAASAENLFMSAFLLTLLAIHALALSLPSASLFSVHPASFILVAAYVFGVHLLARTHDMPMWLPRKTRDTPAEPVGRRSRGRLQIGRLWLHFVGYAMVVALAGWSLAELAVPLGAKTGLSHGVVGGIFTAVSTSIPELVVAITAVRMGALNLAVGDIIGGNAFDTLFVAASDFAYRDGPIYAAISSAEQFWLANAMLMTGVLLMGLIYRQRHGPGNIGLESVILLVLYFGGVAVLSLWH
ncbi:sodium:calcium antiporter [Marinobacterium sediminicola]|uniref:Cation:H+ antiporter n=1 Tax=Marinobacterium sediminicola TaxID=518898 RepID=A0ABY1S0S3_9GAMM|nr:sodium:calcium antiporter [Marinobacterium sediminicola]ULG68313.1 sodium:calcium antiporter [Marinobacterium sediminicola]SMR74829.1 cation:H+ antiporter [Marinobacterium sediminicola]